MLEKGFPSDQLLLWTLDNPSRDFWVEIVLPGRIKLVMVDYASRGQGARMIRVYHDVNRFALTNGEIREMEQLIKKGLDQWQNRFGSLT